MNRTLGTGPRLFAALGAVLAVLAVAGPANAVSGDPGPDGTVAPLIVGGQPATEQYRWAGSMQHVAGDDPHWHTCGAALTTLSRRHAVTAAHCVSNTDGTLKDPSLYWFRFGSTDRLSGGVVVDAVRFIVHEKWNWGTVPGGEYDLAVVQLDRPVYGVPQVSIPPRLLPSKTARIIGWGLTAWPWEGPAPQHLNELDTRIVEASSCAFAGIGVGEICVGDPPAGACYGDSGSPVLQRIAGTDRWAAVGGTSRGAAGCTSFAVYTDWTYFRDWIETAMRPGYKPAPRSQPTITLTEPCQRPGCR